MKSLDEILSERAQEVYQDSLVDILNPASWTTENRDSKLLEIRKLGELVSKTSEDFVLELLNTTLDDGKSVLWHKINEQFTIGEIELLSNLRNELDSSVEIPIDLPFDYEWLSQAIKERYSLINSRVQQIGEVMSKSGVEEL